MKPVKVYIGWSRGKAIVSKLICWLDGGRFNHVFLRFVFADGSSLIYESHIKGGVQITPTSRFMKAFKSGKVDDYCEFPLTEIASDAQKIWNNCEKLHGKGYDRFRILTYYLWIRFTRRKGKRILKLHSKNRYTCNEFVCHGASTEPEFRHTDYSLTIEPLYVKFWGHPSK